MGVQPPLHRAARVPARRPASRWPRASTAGLVLLLICPPVPADEGVSAQRFVGPPPRTRVRELAAGRFLVATRNLPDPNFNASVVLLAEFGAEGAMGLIINMPAEVPVSRVLGSLKGASGRSDTVYIGGPVSQTGVVALVRSSTAIADSRRVLEDVYLVTSRETLEAVLNSGAHESTVRLYVGYSGWGPGQLEQETARGSWHVLSADPDVVFDPEPGSVWRRQIQRTEGLRMARRPGDEAGGQSTGRSAASSTSG